MPISVALVAVAVVDLDEAKEFYSRLFDRPADVEPMPSLAHWDLDPSGGVQVVEDADTSHVDDALRTMMAKRTPNCTGGDL